jgi:hypothetical protein
MIRNLILAITAVLAVTSLGGCMATNNTCARPCNLPCGPVNSTHMQPVMRAAGVGEPYDACVP